MTAGIPVAPVSTAYSLLSADHARIRQIAALIRPGGVFAEDADQFAAALDALDGPGRLRRRSSSPAAAAAAATAGWPTWQPPRPARRSRAAYAALGPDTLAKILFTSGSTGEPKGVLNTHGMLSANQVMMRHAWPFLAGERPVIVDWLPWSHTFGGNHDINMMITAGGTLYIDAGRPAPALFGQSLANLADVPPTIYLNVPAGYAQLVPVLEADPEFARAVLLPAAPHAERGRRAAAEPAPAPDRRGRAGQRPPDPGHQRLGPDRDLARVHLGALRLRRPGVHRDPAAGRRGQARPGRRRLRDPGPRPARDAGLLRAARPDQRGVRRGGLLPDRRRGAADRRGASRAWAWPSAAGSPRTSS